MNWLLLVSAGVQVVLVVLGAAITVREGSAKKHPNVVIAVFVLLGLIGMWVAFRQDAQSSLSNEKLKVALADLGKSSQEIARMTNLNTQLQQRLLNASERISNLTETAISTNTGGDSFCYLDFRVHPGAYTLPVVSYQGRFPLYDVQAQIWDMTRMEKFSADPSASPKPNDVFKKIAIGEVHGQPGGRFSLDGFLDSSNWIKTDDSEQRYWVDFYGRNGRWAEFVVLRFVNGEWKQAIQVVRKTGQGKNKILLEQVDRGFPLTNGRVDWGNVSW